MEKRKKFKLAIFTSPGNKGLEIMLARKLDRYFDYDIIESVEQIQALPTPTEYEVCYLLCLGSKVAFKQVAAMLNALVPKSPKLVWVHGMMAGVDFIFCDALRAAPHITVTNTRGAYDSSLAEFVLLSILYFAKNGPCFMRQKADHRFSQEPVRHAHGAKVAILGYGSIGKTTALLLKKALDVHIYAIRRTDKADADDKALLTFQGLHKDLPYVLSEADYVVNILPLTKETTKLFNSEMFKKMKPSAVYINIGRGASTVESDLVDALKTGVIAGAALDVFEVEPLPPTSPLFDLDNVFYCPHSGGFSIDYWDRCISVFEEELARYMAGKPLLHVVSLDSQY